MLRCPRVVLFALCVLFAAALVPAAWAGSADSEAAASGTTDSYRVVAYDTVGDGGVAGLAADKIDVVNFAFATVEKGRVVLTPEAGKRLDQLVALKRAHPHLAVVLSIGGWGAGGFSEAAATAAGRRLFADTAVQRMREHYADGLDIDWEYPGNDQAGIAASPNDRAHFTLLIKELRTRLDQVGKQQGADRHYLLTIASADGPFVAGIDLQAVEPYLDWFNLMTYDFHNALTPTTGHQTGLHASRWAPADARTTSRAVRQYLAAGVPARKIVIGSAFYGRRFDEVTPAHDGRYQTYGKFCCLASWAQIKRDYLDKNGYVRHWDEQAQAAYLWNPTTHSFITYDDPESIAAKAAWVKQNQLGGIMFWEVRLDDDGQLLDAVWNDLR